MQNFYIITNVKTEDTNENRYKHTKKKAKYEIIFNV